MTYEEQQDFKKVVTPLMKWLRENSHPHQKVIVNGNVAELLEGVAAVQDSNDEQHTDVKTIANL